MRGQRSENRKEGRTQVAVVLLIPDLWPLTSDPFQPPQSASLSTKCDEMLPKNHRRFASRNMAGNGCVEKYHKSVGHPSPSI